MATTATTDPKPAAAVESSQPRPKPQRGWFSGLLLRLHFYAGVLVGPFVLIAAMSGGLYALTPTIEQAVYAHWDRDPRRARLSHVVAAQADALFAARICKPTPARCAPWRTVVGDRPRSRGGCLHWRAASPCRMDARRVRDP